MNDNQIKSPTEPLVTAPQLQPIEPVIINPIKNEPDQKPIVQTDTPSVNPTEFSKFIITALIFTVLIVVGWAVYHFFPKNSLKIRSQSISNTINITKISTTKNAIILIVTPDQLNRPLGNTVTQSEFTIEPGTYSDFNILLNSELFDPQKLKSGDTLYGLLVEFSDTNTQSQLPPPLKNIFGQPIVAKFKIL